MNIIEGTLFTTNSHIAIVIARFNKFINDKLLDGAIDVLKRIGCIRDDNITIIWVPGAYELTPTISLLTKINKFDAIMAIGTIIRGDTMHFKYIAEECSIGLSNISIQSNIPVAFGVLITENIEQAIERAGSKNGNKGKEAALTLLEMINVFKMIKNCV